MHVDELTARPILIVEDDPSLLQMLGALLRRRGYRVKLAADGRSALRALSKEDFAVAIVDIELPDISGLDVLANAQVGTLRPIVLSGVESIDAAIAALRIGAFDFLRKPVDPDELLQAVERALSDPDPALHDPLTGLPNRALLADRVRVAITQAHREQHSFSLLFIDLDRFKAVNDQYGHAAGDRLLCEAAGRMRGVLRGGDTLARVGGDEFVALLPRSASLPSARAVAKKIRLALKRPIVAGGRQFVIDCSLGIALYPQHGPDLDHLLHAADQQMYAEKLARQHAGRLESAGHDALG